MIGFRKLLRLTSPNDRRLFTQKPEGISPLLSGSNGVAVSEAGVTNLPFAQPKDGGGQ